MTSPGGRELTVVGRRAIAAPVRVSGKSLIAAANAMMRAHETERPEAERILTDAWAVHMADRDWRLRAVRAARHLVPPLRRTISELQVAHCVRHRAIDELVCRAVERDRFTQVVTVGAGYDMRPYRFADRLSDVRWFEFDHPATQGFKHQLLAELPRPVEVHRAPIDLTIGSIASALAATPFDPWGSTCFVVEGLIHYLSMSQLEGLFGGLASASRRVRIVFSFIRSDVYARRTATLTWLVKRLREVPTLHFHPDEIHVRLARHRLDQLLVWTHDEQIEAFAPHVTRRARLAQDVAQVDGV